MSRFCNFRPLRKPIIWALLACSPVFSQTVDTTYQRPVFLDTFSMALGGATAALVDNTVAMFGNPASADFGAKAYDFYLGGQLASLGGMGFGVADTFTSPVSGALSFHYFAKNGETNFGPSNSSIRFSLSFGYQVKDFFRFALAGNLYRGLAFGSTNVFYSLTPGFLFDLGFLKLGLYAPDVISFVETQFPSQYILGVSKNFGKSLLLSAQGGYIQGRNLFPDNAMQVRGGVRFKAPKLITLSVGYSGDFSSSDPSKTSHTASLGIEAWVASHRVIITESYNFSRQENTLSIGYRYTPTDEPVEPEDNITNF